MGGCTRPQAYGIAATESWARSRRRRASGAESQCSARKGFRQDPQGPPPIDLDPDANGNPTETATENGDVTLPIDGDGTQVFEGDGDQGVGTQLIEYFGDQGDGTQVIDDTPSVVRSWQEYDGYPDYAIFEGSDKGLGKGQAGGRAPHSCRVAYRRQR